MAVLHRTAAGGFILHHSSWLFSLPPWDPSPFHSGAEDPKAEDVFVAAALGQGITAVTTFRLK